MDSSDQLMNYELPFPHHLPLERKAQAITHTGPPNMTAFALPRPLSPANSSPGFQEHTDYSEHLPLTTLTHSRSSSQKRTYRQRRKDPSCDACRERKVKCDATELNSCSECLNRGVKCAFTKETNRRMSSIKLIQDLQTQLADARAQIHRLQPNTRESQELGSTFISQNVDTTVISAGRGLQRRRDPLSSASLEHVRKNIRIHSHGLFRPPYPYRHISGEHVRGFEIPELPTRSSVIRLVDQYYQSFHQQFPILNWTSFNQDYERLYTDNEVSRWKSRGWVSLFFTVLACGSLQSLDYHTVSSEIDLERKSYLDIALIYFDISSDDFNLDHTRAALLLSIFFFETNARSTSSVWMGVAVKIAYDVGLHCSHLKLTTLEGDLRSRLWWAVYSWDRFLSLEYGTPMLISENKNRPTEPDRYDDRSGPRYNSQALLDGQGMTISFITLMHAATSIVDLKRLFRGDSITQRDMKIWDSQLKEIQLRFPHHFQEAAESYLQPSQLSICFSIETVRLHMYRHNLSPSCTDLERSDALAYCISVARTTANYIRRTLRSSSPEVQHREEIDMVDRSWHLQIVQNASSLWCCHLWRCILISSLMAEYSTALTCLLVSSAIGDSRILNLACGKNLLFFLDRLTERIQTGHGDIAHLEQDEEMLAYASGDMQASLDHGWIWIGSEPPSASVSTIQKVSRDSFSPQSQLPQPTRSFHADKGGFKEGADWDKIKRILNLLLQNESSLSGNGMRRNPSSGEAQRGITLGRSSRISITSII